MLNKLKSILPEKDNFGELKNKFTHEEAIGYNECIKDVEALLPDMLALIREEIEDKKYSEPMCDEHFGGYNEALDDILNILK